MVHIGCRHIIRVTIVVQLWHTSEEETKSVLDRLVNTCVKISSGNLCILVYVTSCYVTIEVKCGQFSRQKKMTRWFDPV